MEDGGDHVIDRGIGSHDSSGDAGACGDIGGMAGDEDSIGRDGIELSEADDSGILKEPLEIGEGSDMLIVVDEIGIG